MKELRGLWGRMIPAMAFLVLFVSVMTANAYTISGTVTNNTGKAGSRVYLSVASQYGGNAMYGVSIPTPGPNASAPYAIRGVPDGSYVVNAFLDSRSNTSATRHSNDPFGSSQPVTIDKSDVTNADITLHGVQNPPALQAPTHGGVLPGPGVALVNWDTPRDNNGFELAYSYNIYWRTDNTVSPTNYTGKKSGIPARGDGMYIQTMLNDTTPLAASSTTLWYVVEAQRGQSGQPGYEVAPSAVYGPVTIGANPTVHPSTFDVSGTVTIDSGITLITGPLFVAVHSESNGVYLARINNPGASNNFTITGVPNGSYEVFSLIDQNDDGLIWAGDYTVGDRNAPMITVNGADVSAPTSNIPKKNVEASVTTSHSIDAAGIEEYGLRFNASQAFQLPVNVAIQGGQDVSGPVDLALSGDKGEFSYSVNNVARPAAGTQYILDLGYADGSTGSVPVAITAVLDSFPEPIAPKGKVTFNATPNFSWAPPASPPASFTYNLNLNGNNFWWNTNDPMPSSQTSALFNFDGNAQGSLSDNASYTWSIAVYDPNGNQASKSATFFSGGSISGKVTEGTLTGPGIPGISVQLYDGNGNGMPWNFNTTTATNGSFTVGGLQAGTYRVCFSTGQTGYIARCYDIASYDSFNATNIPVTAQTDTPNINVALAKAAKITGTVTASGGGAIQGVSVELRDSNGNWVNGQNQTQTDGNGAYTLSGVQTGVSFKLYFNGAAKGYIGQWYNGASDQEGAESITLNAGQNFTADATLVQGASITGTVTNSVSHAGIQGINVQLYDQNGSWIWTNSNITTGADGTYTIGGLVSGTYKVCFNSGSTNYIGKCYDNLVNEPSNATSIQLTAPEARTGIDAALVQGGTISGRVTNGTSGGIQWVNVQLRGTDGNWVSGVPGASTQPDGNYTLGGVPAGDYKVFFDGANTGYVGKWYNVTGAVADQAGATTLTIDTGDMKTNIDAVLPQGGSISGQVTDIDTTLPISGINVQIFDNSGQSIPNAPFAMTGGNGDYNIGGLPDGNYKVCFNSGSTSYLGKCYNQLALDPANATSIQIDLGVNGGNVTGKNASLKLGATITGLVTNGSTPIPNINVQLQNPDGSWVQSGITDANGNYAIRAIPAGDYKVFFDTFNTNYVRQWYNGKSSLNSADQITLANGGSRTGVNAVLALGGTITGKVINDSSLPIPGNPVQLWDTNNNPINFTNSDQNGNYTFSGLAAGNYKVQYHDAGPYFGEWYNDKPSSVLADAVAVTAGQITTLADAVLSTRQPTTTTLASTGPNPSIYGNSVSFTATVNQPGASGIVRFLVDGAEYASSSLVGGNAGATIQNVPAGTHTVTAAYVGDVTNMGSTSNQLIQTVTTATLTVTADALVKGYGAIDPPLTYTYNGIVNGDPPSIFTGSLTREAGASVGDYAIQQGSLSAGNNYQINFTGANLTITAAALTVTANNASRTYGAANPSLNVSYTGFKTGETAANLGGTLSVTTLAVQSSAPGTYAITPSGLTSSNYSITFSNGTLTINKATLTVTSDNLTKAYGSVNPPLTYTITGFTNGETLATSGVSGNPVLSTTAVTGSNVGTYPITVAPGGLTAANYDFTLVNGTLSVTKATATLTLSNLTQTVGSTQPVTVTTSPGGLSVVTVTYTGISGTTYGPSTTAPSAIGNYSVVASLSNANYQATDAIGTLAITAKPTPVINWSNPSNITYGTPLSGTQLNATATDPVTSATVPGTFVYTPAAGAVLNAGSQILSVTFTPDDTNAYNGATKPVTLNVLARALTVTADAKTKVYGAADPALTYQITSGSLVVGDSLTGSLTRVAGENIGSYAIQQGAVSAGGNYTITYAGSNLTITTKPLTITADAKTKVYGAGDPALTYQTTSGNLVAGDSLSGTLSRATGENAGTYAIQQGTLSAGANYAITYFGANLTVTAKPLTVTADAKTKVYGAVDPSFTYTQTGLLAGDSFSGTLSRAAGENVGTYAFLQGTLGAGANYTISFVSANMVISAKTLNVTGITAANKTYDGTTAATLNVSGAGLSGIVGGDTVSLNTGTASGAFSDANVGTGKPVILGGLSLNNNSAGNYTLQSSVTTTGNITAVPLTVTADGKTKVYGAADPALTYQITSGSLVAGDSITGTLSRAAGENVGTHAIQQGTVSAGGNYAITYAGANLTITAKPLTITADAKTRVYGAGDPALTYQITSGSLVAGDSISGTLSRAAGENAGTYAIQQGTLSAGVNYAITYSGANLTITAKPLTITADAKTKVYGAADPSFTYTQAGLLAGDSISGTLTRAAGETVAGGPYQIQQGSVTAGSNYAITYVSANLTITKKPLTISGITATNKVYDGTTTATLSGTGTLGGVVGGDDVALNGTASGTFDTKNVGTGKTVSFTGLTLTGTTAGNYSITGTASTTANITAVTLTASGATAANRVYNGTSAATVTSLGSLTGVITADVANVTLTGPTAGTFTDANVGTGKTVTITGLGLSGTESGNYVLASTTTTATANITTAPLTVTADAKNKVYGSVDPPLTYQSTGVLFAGDSITGALTRAAGETVAGGPYQVQQGSVTAGSNYAITYVAANLTITQKSLTISGISAANKVYDGSTTATLSGTGTLVGVVGADNVSLNGTASGTFDTKNVGTGKTVNYSGLTLTGTTAGNYSITGTASTTANITSAPLTVTADAKSKEYGSPDPALTYQLTSGVLFAGDAFSSSLTRAAGETVTGGPYAINQGTLTAGANYTITFIGANLTITKATPVITWANPAVITFGTALGTAQLNATASTAGTFAYTPASGTVLNAGNQALSVSFIPTDTANFNAAPVTKSVTINVLKATPAITWSNPADLAFGTPLSATQLNATASVPGTFVYTPASGTVLDPGSQTLSVTFTPTDTANFATATKTVNVNAVAANGDANQDGKVGIEDALLALQIAVGLVPMDAKYLAYCDVAPYVNGKPQPDRKIDIGDALVILRKVVGTL